MIKIPKLNWNEGWVFGAIYADDGLWEAVTQKEQDTRLMGLDAIWTSS